MKTTLVVCLLLIGSSLAFTGEDYELISFQKTALSDLFYAEGATFGDLNGDGVMDLIAGPFWYEGPTYEQVRAFQPVLKKDGWNDMTVRAVGPRIQVWVNGVQTVDYTEHDHIPQSGVICLQIHSGAPAEAWHKDLVLKEIAGGE